jgi:hypothetical protein
MHRRLPRERFLFPVLLAAATITMGQDLKAVAIRILEIEATASVTMVDFAGPRLSRVGPVSYPAFLDSTKYLLELEFPYQERIVLMDDFSVGVECEKIETDSVVGFHYLKRSEAGRGW